MTKVSHSIIPVIIGLVVVVMVVVMVVTVVAWWSFKSFLFCMWWTDNLQWHKQKMMILLGTQSECMTLIVGSSQAGFKMELIKDKTEVYQMLWSCICEGPPSEKQK